MVTPFPPPSRWRDGARPGGCWLVRVGRTFMIIIVSNGFAVLFLLRSTFPCVTPGASRLIGYRLWKCEPCFGNGQEMADWLSV